MDPVSITAAAFTASTTAYKVSTCLYGFIQSAKTVDESLNMLYDAVRSLEGSLTNVDSTMKTSVVHVATADTKAHRGPLASISQSVKDCKHTLKALESRLEDIGRPGANSNFFRKSILQIQLNMGQSEIDNLRSHIQSHSTSLQVAINTLML